MADAKPFSTLSNIFFTLSNLFSVLEEMEIFIRLPWRFALLILLCWELELCVAVKDEGRALLRFKENLVDQFGALADWTGDGASDPCLWFGVGCAKRRVVSLMLNNRRLQGTLAPELGKLVHLKYLNTGNRGVRRFLQANKQGKSQNHSNGRTQKTSPLPSPYPSSHTLVHQSKPLSSPSLSPSQSPGISPSQASIFFPNFLPPSSINNVPASQPSPPSRGSISSNFIPNPGNLPMYPSLISPPPAFTPSPGGPNQGKHASSRTIYISIIGGVSFLIILIIFIVFGFRAHKVVTVKPWSTGLSGQLQKAFVSGVPALKRSEIEVACEDFSNIIGSLPDCKLYKGTLSSGVEIAVVSTLIKSSKDWSKQCESQFRKKISTLSKVNHKNFVNLLGYCEEEKPFTRMMVFEYASNGTLYEHLHVKDAEHLNWATRLRIAMGVAYCLDHMHQLNPPVTMKTLDSSSIYLTEDYAAKVSDIRFWGVESYETQSLTPNHSGILEAPILEPKDAIYSFGLLLIEMLSGRITASGDLPLENWALCYLNGERPVREMMDPTLDGFREENVVALCEVIRSCINPGIHEKPTMSKIVSQMKDITMMMPDRVTPMASPLWWAELEILTS